MYHGKHAAAAFVKVPDLEAAGDHVRPALGEARYVNYVLIIIAVLMGLSTETSMRDGRVLVAMETVL